MQKTVAFIGLGAMGLNSAKRLVEAGYRVQAYDVKRTALDDFAGIGGVACVSAAQAVLNASHVILFVVNGQQAEDVIFGPDSISKTASKGLIIISCVTMLPEEARVIGERCEENSWAFIDAPVSGGQVGARAGALVIMAAGNTAAIDDSEDVLLHIGNRLKRVGNRPGQGAVMKTINQLLCGVHLAAAGEAMGMAKYAGLDLKIVLDVVSQSAAGSWMLTDRGPRMVAGSYEAPTSVVDIFVKDLGIVLDVARALRFAAPVSASALQSFLGASGAGLGSCDDAAVMEYYERRNMKPDS